MNFSFKNRNLLTHGDGDGALSGAVGMKHGAYNLTITQPFLIHKLPNLKKQTVILDIAVDNRNPEATYEWAKRNEAMIVAWVDHHAGGEKLNEILGEKFYYDLSQPSCPAFLAELGFEFPQEWVDAANACDRPRDYKATPLSKRYNAAFKVSLVELQAGDKQAILRVQNAFIEELLTGKESDLVTAKAKEYPALLKRTEKAAENFKNIASGVVITSVPTQASADITALLFKGYDKASVAVVQTKSVEDGSPVTIIGTNKDAINLVKKFGLQSGNTQRIVLRGEHKEVRNRIKSVFA